MIDRGPHWHHVTEGLSRHIQDLIPSNPEILSLTDPWDLYGVHGFSTPVSPSRAQLIEALQHAKAQHKLEMLEA